MSTTISTQSLTVSIARASIAFADQSGSATVVSQMLFQRSSKSSTGSICNG